MGSVKKEQTSHDATTTHEFSLKAAPASWTHGLRYNVLKFGSASTVKPTEWKKPIKLNRRTEVALRRAEEGDEALEDSQEPKRRAFQRKTNRIMHSEESSETLQMRKEERNDWLLEDSSTRHPQRWSGRVEGTVGTGTDNSVAANSHYVFLILDKTTQDFKVIPGNRIYKFSKRPTKTSVLDAEQADAEFSRRNRSFWSGHGRNDSNSPSHRGRVKGEPVETHRLLGKAIKKEGDLLRERKSGERTMKATYDKGLFGSDDEDTKPRIDKDEGAFDEVDYEEDIQDDEEGAGFEVDDANDAEDNREAQDKRKREMLAANRSGDEEEDDIDKKGLDSAGKRAKKLMRKMGKVEYESDEDPEERNPYASDQGSSTDDERKRRSHEKKKVKPAKALLKSRHATRPSLPGSRAGSPSPSVNSGSAAVARRATSPRPNTPRGTSPGPSKRKAEDGTRGSGSKRARTATPVGSELNDADVIEFLRKSKGQVVPIVDVLKYAKKVLGVDVKTRLAELQAVLDRIGIREAGGVMLKPELE